MQPRDDGPVELSAITFNFRYDFATLELNIGQTDCYFSPRV